MPLSGDRPRSRSRHWTIGTGYSSSPRSPRFLGGHGRCVGRHNATGPAGVGSSGDDGGLSAESISKPRGLTAREWPHIASGKPRSSEGRGGSGRKAGPRGWIDPAPKPPECRGRIGSLRGTEDLPCGGTLAQRGSMKAQVRVISIPSRNVDRTSWDLKWPDRLTSWLRSLKDDSRPVTTT